MNKYNKYKKQHEKDQQTNKSFNKFYTKTLQDNIVDKNDYESRCSNFTEHVVETKNESFL